MSSDVSSNIDHESVDAKHAERLERIKAARNVRLPRGKIGDFQTKPTTTEIPLEYIEAEARTMVAGMAYFPYLREKNINGERQAAEERLMDSECVVRNELEPNHFNMYYTCVTPTANAEHLWELEDDMAFLRENEEGKGERKCHFYRMDMGNGEFALKIVVPVTVHDGRIGHSVLFAIFPSSNQSELIWEGLRSEKVHSRDVIAALARHIHPDLPSALYTTEGEIPVGRMVHIPEKFVNEALEADRAKAAAPTGFNIGAIAGALQSFFTSVIGGHDKY